MAPRSTALAGAQLAARQLNRESVFRGVLRGWNNAPAASVAPRGSTQPGCISIRRDCAQQPAARKGVPSWPTQQVMPRVLLRELKMHRADVKCVAHLGIV